MASSDPELERHIAETKQCCAARLNGGVGDG